VVAADLEKGEWIVIDQQDGQYQTLLVKPSLTSLDSFKRKINLANDLKNLEKSVFDCISLPTRRHQRILLEDKKLSPRSSEATFNTDLKGIFVTSPSDGQKCIKPTIRRATMADISKEGDESKQNIGEMKETWNPNQGIFTEAPKKPFLIQPSCSQKLEPIMSVSKIKGTSTLIFSNGNHESISIEDVSRITTQPLGPILCKGRFKGIGGQMIATSEETVEISRNVTDVNNSTITKHENFKGLIPPSCSFRLEPIVSVSQKLGTNTLIFEAPEHESFTTEEIQVVTSQQMRPVMCKGRFKGIGGQIVTTSEETVEIPRNMTDVNNTTVTKHEKFKGLIPPTCSYRLEPIASVSQKQGTNTLIFEAPEHETFTTEEIQVVTSQQMGPVMCKGRFQQVSSSPVSYTERTMSQTSIWRSLEPVGCESSLPEIAEFTYSSVSDMITIRAPQHFDINIVEASNTTGISSHLQETFEVPADWKATYEEKVNTDPNESQLSPEEKADIAAAVEFEFGFGNF
jgi:hypothetical protein